MAFSTLENGGGNRFRSKDKSPECHYPILKYDAELGRGGGIEKPQA